MVWLVVGQTSCFSKFDRLVAHHPSAAPPWCSGIEELCLEATSIWVLKGWEWYLALQSLWLLSSTVWGVWAFNPLGTQSQSRTSALVAAAASWLKIQAPADWCSRPDMPEHVSFRCAWRLPGYLCLVSRRGALSTDGGHLLWTLSLWTWGTGWWNPKGCGMRQCCVWRSPWLTCMKVWWLAWVAPTSETEGSIYYNERADYEVRVWVLTHDSGSDAGRVHFILSSRVTRAH